MPKHEEQVPFGRFSEVIIMPIPWVGQCVEGARVPSGPYVPGQQIEDFPIEYLGRRIETPELWRNRSWGPGPFMRFWFERNGRTIVDYFVVDSFREVPCRPEDGPVKLASQKKVMDAEIRRVYEGKTNQSAAPGTGPADIIRKMVGVQPPKRAGGTHRRKNRKNRRGSRRK